MKRLLFVGFIALSTLINAQVITIESNMLLTYELDTILPLQSIRQLEEYQNRAELYDDTTFQFSELRFFEKLKFQITPTTMTRYAEWIDNETGLIQILHTEDEVISFEREGNLIRFSTITTRTTTGSKLQIDYIVDVDMNKDSTFSLLVSSYKKGNQLKGSIYPRMRITNWDIQE
jgi:hypothetical protein